VHILTKVFVLIAALLSIMMAALAISYSVNADRITADYRDALAASDAAMAQLSAVKSAHGQQKAALEQDINALRDELASRDADTRRLEATNSELRIALRQAEAARESISSKIAQLGVTTETQARMIDEYKSELSRLHEAELSYRDEKIDLEKAISDLQSQVIVYEQVKRALQEQIQDMQIAMADTTGEGIASSGDSPRDQPVTEIPGPPVSGSIDEVLQNTASGNTLVRINLGSNDRLRENARLYIHRDDTFLGELVVQSVDLNHAVGRVAYTANNQQIREGDRVMTKLGS